MFIFFGAGEFSAGEGIKLRQDDLMQIRFEGLGRPLRNSLTIDRAQQKAFAVSPL